MKVLLVFPPQWTANAPYLSLPSLASYLIDKGVDVIQKDFNVESFEIMLSKSYLNELSENITHQFKILNSREALSPGFEQQHYLNLFKAKSIVKSISGKIDNAKNVLRCKEQFYDTNALYHAKTIINQAFGIIATAYAPTYLDLSSFEIMGQRGSFTDIEITTSNKSINPYIDLYEKHMLPFVKEHNPNVVGISIVGESQLIPGLTLARLLKSMDRDLHVVIGGHVVTLLADVIKKTEGLFRLFFDSAILYEGELPLFQLVDHLDKGRALGDVPNLIYFDGERVRSNSVSEPTDIETLPAPNFDGLPFSLYFSPETVLPILASRGCSWGKCAFCSHPSGYGKGYRVRSAEQVINDMVKMNHKYRAVHFAFSDADISPEVMNKLSDEIISKKLDVACSANIRIEPRFTSDLCHKAAKAGFKLFYLGLESGCNRVLSHMNKGITTETAATICKNVVSAGIWNHLCAFFGFPTESKAESQETIDFILGHRDVISSFYISYFVLGRGSLAQLHPEWYGIENISMIPEENFNLYFDYSVSSGLTNREAKFQSLDCMGKIFQNHEGNRIFKYVDQENLLLFLTHFRSTDFISRMVSETKQPKLTKPILTERSIPSLGENVIFEHLHFDLTKVRQHISNGTNRPLSSCPIKILFNLENCRFKAVNEQVSELLDKCANLSIKQLARNESWKSGIPQDFIQHNYLELLNYLAEDGFISAQSSVASQHQPKNVNNLSC